MPSFLWETGVGKSPVLEFMANVLLGKDTDHYDFEMLDHTNEQGGHSVFVFFIFGSSLGLRYFFWSAMVLLRRN